MKSTFKPKSGVHPSRTAVTGSASIIALLAASTQQADAQVTLGGAGFTVDNNTNYSWDVDGNGSQDFTIRDTYSYMTSVYASFATQALVAPSNQGLWLKVGGKKLGTLGTSAVVSAGGSFGAGGYITNYGGLNSEAVGFVSGQSAYVGFSFKISGNTHYGWVELTPTFGSGNKIQVHQWAWNATADASIQVGDTGSAVPEPAAAATGLGLLALGAAGLRRQRWLKRNAA